MTEARVRELRYCMLSSSKSTNIGGLENVEYVVGDLLL